MPRERLVNADGDVIENKRGRDLSDGPAQFSQLPIESPISRQVSLKWRKVHGDLRVQAVAKGLDGNEMSVVRKIPSGADASASSGQYAIAHTVQEAVKSVQAKLSDVWGRK